MSSPSAPGASREETGPSRRFVVAEDLPLTIFVGVATAVVFGLRRSRLSCCDLLRGRRGRRLGGRYQSLRNQLQADVQ